MRDCVPLKLLHNTLHINNQTLRNNTYWQERRQIPLIAQMKISNCCLDCCLCVTFCLCAQLGSEWMKAKQREASRVIFNPALLFLGIITFFFFFAPSQDVSVILTWQYLPTPLFHSQFHLLPNTISHSAGFN